MDKSDSEKFAELEAEFNSRNSKEIEFHKKADALVKKDVKKLLQTLKDTGLQKKLDQIIGWYNYKLNEYGLPDDMLRINEVMQPIPQRCLDRYHYEVYTLKDGLYNYNHHYSLISSEFKEDDKYSNWLEQFKYHLLFRIEILCHHNIEGSTHPLRIIYRVTEGELGSGWESDDCETVDNLIENLQEVLMNQLKSLDGYKDPF